MRVVYLSDAERLGQFHNERMNGWGTSNFDTSLQSSCSSSGILHDQVYSTSTEKLINYPKCRMEFAYLASGTSL